MIKLVRRRTPFSEAVAPKRVVVPRQVLEQQLARAETAGDSELATVRRTGLRKLLAVPTSDLV